MRSIISYFIKYPVAVNVTMFAIIIFGVVGMYSMKSSFFPLTETKMISISAAYPGASPAEMEEGIVLKIEDNLKGIEGVDRITSRSYENSAAITVEIEKGYDIDVLLAEVKNAVDRVPSFPTGMEPLIVAKKDNHRETVSFSINGKGISLKNMKQVARGIENDLRAIEGLSQVEITGFPLEEIEIAVREKDLLAYNLTFQEISRVISQENILITGGNIKTELEEYLIRANSRSYYADELEQLIVKTDESGNNILLKDIAVLRDRFSETPNSTFFNGKLSIQVSVKNTNEEDLISSAEAVKNYIAEFNEKYDNIHLDIVRDSSITLVERTALLQENAIIGMLLVLFFLTVFLDARLAFWVAIGLPVAFAGMFIFAPGLDVTINVLSLFGMIIVIGILVDDGIVIAENIYHHHEKGKSPIQAAIDGTMEVIPPVISAIITTILAFTIFFYLDGRIGDLFGEVSIVVLLTLMVSLIEALIILPSHIAHSKAIQKDVKEENKNFIDKAVDKIQILNFYGNKFLMGVRDRIYSPALRWMLENQFVSFSILLSLLILTFASIKGGIIKTTFFPPIASDRVAITLKMPEGTSAQITDSILIMIEEKVWEVNETFTEKQTGNLEVISNCIKSINGASNGSLQLNLLPGESRDFSSDEVANAINDLVGPVYGVETLSFGSGRNFGGSPVAVSLLSNNIAELKAAKLEVKQVLLENDMLRDVSDNDPEGIKEIRLKLKDNAYPLGLTTREVMAQVRNGFFGLQVQRFQRGQDEIKVWVRYDLSNRESIQQLDEMRIISPKGDRIPLSEIASYSIIRGEVAINHLDGIREIQVSADLKNPSESATDILADLKENVIPGIQAKYPTIQVSFEGQNRETSKFMGSILKVGLIILGLILVTIAFTFRSYGQPVLLLLLIPFSLIAVAWGHWLHNFPLCVLSLLGIIALIGIMVNDGLVLIGKFNSNLRDGLKFNEALFEAGESRFRAIFLTSITTMAGLAPLILEKSRQAQFLIPMAVSIAYGIAIATVLTLFLLPIFLSFKNWVKVWFKWQLTGVWVEREEVERAVIEFKAEQNEEH